MVMVLNMRTRFRNMFRCGNKISWLTLILLVGLQAFAEDVENPKFMVDSIKPDAQVQSTIKDLLNESSHSNRDLWKQAIDAFASSLNENEISTKRKFIQQLVCYLSINDSMVESDEMVPFTLHYLLSRLNFSTEDILFALDRLVFSKSSFEKKWAYEIFAFEGNKQEERQNSYELFAKHVLKYEGISSESTYGIVHYMLETDPELAIKEFIKAQPSTSAISETIAVQLKGIDSLYRTAKSSKIILNDEDIDKYHTILQDLTASKLWMSRAFAARIMVSLTQLSDPMLLSLLEDDSNEYVAWLASSGNIEL